MGHLTPSVPLQRGTAPAPGKAGAPEAERGFVLVIVIAVLGLLALAAAGFAQVTRSQVKAAASNVGSSTAQALADAGVQLAVLDLVLGRQDPSYQRRFSVGEKPFVCDAGDGRRLAVSITDEAGKVDLNAASDRLLQALLVGVGASEGVADAIIDFRDDDNVKRSQGAERDEYSAAGRPGPKNAPFSAVEEIEQVLGVDAELAARLRPHITVYPGQPGIDTGSASRELLAILARGLGSDTGPAASRPPDQSGETDSTLPAAMPFMGAQGRRFFAVHAEAYADSSAFVREAVLELGQSRARPYTFLRWYRGTLREGHAALQDIGLAPCP
jgi:general secretion pathway protein K